MVKKRIKTQQQTIDRLNNQNQQTKHQLKDVKEKIAFFNSDEVMGEQAFQNIKDQINGQQETRTRLSDELDKLKQQRIELNEQIDAQEAKLQVCHQDILAIENHYQDIKAEQSKLDVLIHHAIDHLNDEYQLTVERAKSEYTSDESIDALRKKVKLMKMSIDELGPGNLNAIEQFEELNERYTFLSEQRTDLRKAKETLEQIISEMDQEVTERFKRNFPCYSRTFYSCVQTIVRWRRCRIAIN